MSTPLTSVQVWNKTIINGQSRLACINTLQHVSQFQSEVQASAGITALHPMPQALYTGDENGKVVSTLTSV